jgi:predicted extracellular nuclease
VVGRRQVFTSNLDAEVWVMRGDHPVALRNDRYARRVFRDPHPLDNIPKELFDDGNGYRILMGSLGIKAAAGDNRTLIAPARTFDKMAAAAVGGVYFAFNKYSVQVGQQLSLIPGVDPSAKAPLKPFDRGLEFSVATFNVENLYDFRDDPFDGCDFPGNPGCPGVNPPFDYVPASDAVYQRRLGELASQIINDLRAPDIIMVQEAEDQDICVVASGALACGATNNADGKPDTLQELGLVIERLGGPRYDAASDRDGADDRGIVSGFLYRTDRVELPPADMADPVLGLSPLVQYRTAGLAYNTDVQNPKALNAPLPADVDTSTGVDGTLVFTRAPQVARFRVWRTHIGASIPTSLYVISNHFSSGPDIRVGQRREQAGYNTAIVVALRQFNEDVRVIVGGDLNVFPRPDDPFAPGHALFPSDQLASLYAQKLVNLWERLVARSPSRAYSYVFDGQAQTLDSLFVSKSQFRLLQGVFAAHVNSDWPVAYDGDGPRGASDHDPQGARFKALHLDGLIDLVWYLHAAGAMPSEAATKLQTQLLRARKHEPRFEHELWVFINQVERLTPRSISRSAADALKREALALLGSGH